MLAIQRLSIAAALIAAFFAADCCLAQPGGWGGDRGGDRGSWGGDRGGFVVGEGTPEQIAELPGSYTGKFLAPVLKKADGKPRKSSSASEAAE